MIKQTIKPFIILTLIILITDQIHSQFDWVQDGQDLVGLSANDEFGGSVDMNEEGNIIAIGAPNANSTGTVSVFIKENGSWTAMGDPIMGEIIGEDFGWSVSLSDDGMTIIIGAPEENGGGNPGNAYIYIWDGTVWNQKGENLSGINNDDYFGWDVDISSDGNTIAVSAPKSDFNAFNAGSVKIYSWLNNQWIGTNLYGEVEYGEFGGSIALNEDGDIIVIGIPHYFGEANPGTTVVYALEGFQWVQRGEDIVGSGGFDHTGTCVDITNDGLRIAIGAFNASCDNASACGEVRIFDWDNTAWNQVGSAIEGNNSFDNLGYSLQLNNNGSTIVVGTPSSDENGSRSGDARVFHWDNSAWNQLGTPVYGVEGNERSGTAVGINGGGDQIVVGSPLKNIDANTDAGEVKAYRYTLTTSVFEAEINPKVSLYPNPTYGSFRIASDDDLYVQSIKVVNTLGALVAVEEQVSGRSFSMFIEGSPGLYLIVMELENGSSKEFKIIKQ